MSEKETLERRPVWLTPEQIEWLDLQVARRRREVAESRAEGEEMPQISRSSIIRDWIDSQLRAVA